MTTLTSLPPSPQRSNPDTFANLADAWVNALESVFTPEMNLIIPEINALSSSATNAANNAIASADTATTQASLAQQAAISTGSIAWVSGTTYSVGDLRYSPTDFQTYRRKTTGAGTTDPSLDLTNWLRVSGDVSSNTTQTLTNKTLNSAVFNDGYTEEVFSVTGTAPALSPTNGSIQTWVLSANSAPTAGTWGSGQSLTLMIDDGSAFSVNWASLSVVWKTNLGTAPILQTNGYTVIQLWKVGTVIYGARVGDA